MQRMSESAQDIGKLKAEISSWVVYFPSLYLRILLITFENIVKNKKEEKVELRTAITAWYNFERDHKTMLES